MFEEFSVPAIVMLPPRKRIPEPYQGPYDTMPLIDTRP